MTWQPRGTTPRLDLPKELADAQPKLASALQRAFDSFSNQLSEFRDVKDVPVQGVS